MSLVSTPRPSRVMVLDRFRPRATSRPKLMANNTMLRQPHAKNFTEVEEASGGEAGVVEGWGVEEEVGEGPAPVSPRTGAASLKPPAVVSIPPSNWDHSSSSESSKVLWGGGIFFA